MGGYHLCCGHRVENIDDVVGIEFEDYIVDRGDFEDGGGMGMVYMPVCKKCLPKYLREFNARITPREVDMASNVIVLNNQIRWDVPDDKMEKLIKYLDAIGQKVIHEDPLKGAWVSAREEK